MVSVWSQLSLALVVNTVRHGDDDPVLAFWPERWMRCGAHSAYLVLRDMAVAIECWSRVAAGSHGRKLSCISFQIKETEDIVVVVFLLRMDYSLCLEKEAAVFVSSRIHRFPLVWRSTLSISGRPVSITVSVTRA
jgi:hypothetical protein